MMQRTTTKRIQGKNAALLFAALFLVSSTKTVQANFDHAIVDSSQESVATQQVNPRDILIEFFEQTGGFGWTNIDSWLSNNVCTYTGVTCYDENHEDSRLVGHVQSLELNQNGLAGTTPLALWRLPYLESVEVNGNPQLVVEFTGIANANYLKNLELDGTGTTNFNGLDQAAATLRTLSISELNLQASLPSQVYQLTLLASLQARGSYITGQLQATGLGKLTYLRELVLTDNSIQGNIPTQVGLLSNLQSLQLANNDWTGVLPADNLNQLTELRSLDISRVHKDESRQGLTGRLPSFEHLRFITNINMQNQDLSGSLPEYFLEQASMYKAITVDLRGNNLSGIIPLTLLKSLQNLDLLLADNQLDSVDDASLCSSSQLSRWFNGGLTGGNCNGFLCPKGTYSPTQGRATAQSSCQTCSSAAYMGASTCGTTSSGEVNEVLILRSFFLAMNGAYWKETRGWYDPQDPSGAATEVNVCTWFGITCNVNGQITRIELPNNDLSGSVPPSLFKLPYLETLDLSKNSIVFSFDGIAQAVRLDTLDLTQTDLKSWSKFEQLKQTSIRILRLASNDLTGILPTSIYDLADLQELDVSHNDLSGSIQADKIGNLKHLQHLIIYGNHLSGSLPGSTLCSSPVTSVLVTLQASQNKFTGSLPSEWNNCRQLRQIGLRNNNLSGGLPSWPELANLQKVDLSGNNLQGSLPSDFLSSTGVYQNQRLELYLGDNQLTGSALPSAWASRFDNLVVDLTGNKFSSLGISDCSQNLIRGWMDGFVERFGCDAIACKQGTYNEVGHQTSEDAACRSCQGQAPQVLGARTCAAHGTTTVGYEVDILTELFEATHGGNWKRSDGWRRTTNYCSWYGITCDPATGKVQAISLENNGLTGTPPSSVFELTDLSDLDLRENLIDFSFEGIEKASNLLSLDVSSTNLNSVVGLDKAKTLLQLRLDDNDLKGAFPTEVLALNTLRHLSMNFNQLEGGLPLNMAAQFPFLKELFLMNNRFSGMLPAELGKLSKLTYLGLSGNNWSGPVPEGLNGLSSVQIIDLGRKPESAGRGLFGLVPAFQRLGSLKQLLLGYNSLSGSIPDNFLAGIKDKNAPLVVDLSNNALTGGLPPALARFNSMELYVAGNMLTGNIPSGICRQPGWMKAQVASFGCDAILCPPGYYQPDIGNAHGNKKCQQCASGETTEFYGSFECMTYQEREEREERLILAELYERTNGEQWVKNKGWLDPDVSVCDWSGVVCSFTDGSTQTSVQSIQLAHNGLKGTIPSSIFTLKNLVELDLSWNDIEITFDPSKVSQARSLLYLNLDHTGLTSLTGVQNCPGLEVLHIESNNFGGSFPNQALEIDTLQVLYLSNNDIGGFLPSSIPNQIVGFSCSKCGLQGTFPSPILSLDSLQYLDLSDNDLTSTVPAAISNLVKLKHVDLSNQATADSPGLTGSLPSFASAPELRNVYLQRNGFQYGIPIDFLYSLSGSGEVTVDISFNQLTGILPGDLTRLTNADFYASGNKLTGVSSNLCSLQWNDRPSNVGSDCDYILCGQSKYSGLGRATPSRPCETCAASQFIGSTYCIEGERNILNKLYTALGGKLWTHNDGWGSGGDFCAWYGITCHDGTIRSGTVKTLDLRDNNMKGTLPDDVWLLTEMLELDLSKNDIVVNSFARAGDASSLTALSLSHNTIRSMAGIGGVDSLKSLQCTNCDIEGPMPNELFDLTMLEGLFLSYNSFSGSLPTLIRRLARLKELHLVHNRLNSTLPAELSTLADIEVIALGHNDFTGSIPAGMGYLPSLRVLALDSEKPEVVPAFSVATTGLTGNLPSFSGNKKLRELYLGYNLLGGTIPADFLNGIDEKSDTIIVDLTSNNIHSRVPATLAQFDNLRIYLAENRIGSVAPEICAKSQWMDGLMATNCDALLCPIGTYNDFGRRTPSEDCKTCDHQFMATSFGSMHCEAAFPEYRDDRDMLREIYENADGDGWTNKRNWMDAGSSICNWFGITCDDDAVEERVAEISLPNNNLKGRLASIIFYLPGIRKINVAGNDIRIDLKNIREAENLEEFNAENTLVTDVEGLANAPKLKTLRLSNNLFFGRPFPADIYELTKLRVLEVANAGFSGELSSKLGQLSKLETLILGANELEGSIPDIFATFPNLQVVDLSDNLFHGPVPLSLQSAASLRSLEIRGRGVVSTGLSGRLPPFSNSTKLTMIDLRSNSLTGPIPSNLLAGVDNPTSTEITVLLDSNILDGTLPTALSRFTRLNLNLADNEIEVIPPTLCQMNQWLGGDVGQFSCDGLLCMAGTYAEKGRQASASDKCQQCPGNDSRYLGSTICPSGVKARTKKILQDFYAKTSGANWRNKDGWFTNPDICNWYGITCRDNTFVETINLGSNNLVNTPPREIFEIVGLKNLWLYSNPITFSFEGIGNAKTLQNLQLDSTKTQSIVGVGAAPALTYLDVRFNGISGVLPPEIENLHHLEVLLISENHFFGQLPQFLGNRKLSILRASGNKFSGFLPTLDAHPRIKTVDVANNQLVGVIPDDFLDRADNSNAMMLDISGNYLSGMLPASLSRFSDLTIYARDNRISGIDPTLCSKEGWNSGTVGIYGCDAILCPPQTYTSSGRASAEAGDCQRCPSSRFFGLSSCEGSSANKHWSWRQLAWIFGLLFIVTWSFLGA